MGQKGGHFYNHGGELLAGYHQRREGRRALLLWNAKSLRRNRHNKPSRVQRARQPGSYVYVCKGRRNDGANWGIFWGKT